MYRLWCKGGNLVAKGVLYVMTTAVPNLVKIGKAKKANYEIRMNTLERSGYNNVSGLKRCFAIEVENYSEKELLLHTVFSKSNIAGSELFAVNANIVVQLLASLEGTVIYPAGKDKGEVFDDEAANAKKTFLDRTQTRKNKSTPVESGEEHVSCDNKVFRHIDSDLSSRMPQDFIDESETVSRFIREYKTARTEKEPELMYVITKDRRDMVSKKDFQDRYFDWCANNGCYAVRKKELTVKMQQKGAKVDRRGNCRRYIKDDSGRWIEKDFRGICVFRGVKLVMAPKASEKEDVPVIA